MAMTAISSKIGFADSELRSYYKQGSSLTVEILAWNQSRISILFGDVIRVLDNDANAISGFYEVADGGEALRAALARLYEGQPPADHPYIHYQFLDLEDVPALEVVSRSMEMTYLFG